MSSVKNVYINPNDYYIFIKQKKSTNLEKEFLKGLLKNAKGKSKK